MSVDARIDSVRRRPDNSRQADRKRTYYRGIGLNPQAMAEYAAAHLLRTGEVLGGSPHRPRHPRSSETTPTPTSAEMGEAMGNDWYQTSLSV